MREVIGPIEFKSDRNRGIRVHGVWYNMNEEEYEKVNSYCDNVFGAEFNSVPIEEKKKYPVKLVLSEHGNDVIKIMFLKKLGTKNNAPKPPTSKELSVESKQNGNGYQSKQTYTLTSNKGYGGGDDSIARQVIIKSSVSMVEKFLEVKGKTAFKDVIEMANAVSEVFDILYKTYNGEIITSNDDIDESNDDNNEKE